MKRHAKAASILLALGAIIASAQSTTEDQNSAPQTQARGYWIDSSTKLMWPAKESDKAVTWHSARSYCGNLRLAGHNDWRLPTLDELSSLVNKSAAPPERVGDTTVFSINRGRHVRGGILLTGDAWSSNRIKDRFEHDYGDGSFFDFIHGKPSHDLPYFRNVKYALCVRRSED